MSFRRREFMAALGSAAAWLLATRAQQLTRRIDWTDFVPEADPSTPPRVTAFREGMEKQGGVLGRNLAIDYRWSLSDMETARQPEFRRPGGQDGEESNSETAL
jgi:hypothetical protein